MRNSNFFADSNNRFGYETIDRHSYINMFRSLSALEGLTTLVSTKTIGAAAAGMFFWGVYGIPIMMALIWGSYFIGNFFVRISYSFFGTSRKVRWHTNSVIYMVMTTWIWLWFPAILFTAFLAVATLPYGLYMTLVVNSGSYAIDVMDPSVNLVMKLVGDTLITSTNPVEFVVRYCFWDYMHPVASTIKLMAAPVLGYFVYYRGHSEIFEEDFYAGEEDGRDAWLLYEKR